MRALKIIALVGIVLATISAATFANRIAVAGTVEGQEKTTSIQSNQQTTSTEQKEGKGQPMGEEMQLGNFSVSLAVKNLQVSKAFYEKLDFEQVGGNLADNYVIMQNDTATIGLFQGMFEGNILTFNPGWNRNKETLENFQDVRDLQATVMERGITPVQAADEASKGPASFVIVDPDGNMILVDQHVAKPE